MGRKALSPFALPGKSNLVQAPGIGEFPGRNNPPSPVLPIPGPTFIKRTRPIAVPLNSK